MGWFYGLHFFLVGFTILEAEYDKYCDPVRNIDYAGNQIFNVPRFSGNIGVQYRHHLYGSGISWDALMSQGRFSYESGSFCYVQMLRDSHQLV